MKNTTPQLRLDWIKLIFKCYGIKSISDEVLEFLVSKKIKITKFLSEGDVAVIIHNEFKGVQKGDKKSFPLLAEFTATTFRQLTQKQKREILDSLLYCSI